MDCLCKLGILKAGKTEVENIKYAQLWKTFLWMLYAENQHLLCFRSYLNNFKGKRGVREFPDNWMHLAKEFGYVLPSED